VAEPHSFGRYRVTKPLGTGAMGEVYEAVDDVLGRDVAIKTLRSSSGALFLDDRFRNEARAIAKLTHPNIVAVFDVDVAATPPYLVMERVPGPSLADRLSGGSLPTEQLIPLGIQIARALATAHDAGVVHRDVKPANILAAGPGTWKLADFGVAHVPDSSLTLTGQFVGSPAYAAPEALVKGITGAASDVYGLGATLYEAAAGRWPRLEAKGALLAPVPPLRTLAPALPPHVCDAIDRAVALDHEKRPTAAELAELLARRPSQPPATSPVAFAATTLARPAAPLRWKPYAIGLAALVAIAVFVSTRHSSSSSSPAAGVAPDTGDDAVDLDAELQQIADQANAGDVDGARERLDELEHQLGPGDPEAHHALHDLRKQLDDLRKPDHGRKHRGRPGD
jgi:serine/threonine-protein kinase